MDPKLLLKLQKVMALAKEGVDGEAEAAAAILQKMLTEHNLSIADLEKKGAAQAPHVGEKAHDLGKAAFTWKLDLAEAVAEHFYCVSLVNRRTKTVAFVGRPDNVESLTMLYAWLIGQVQIVAREERTKHAATTAEHIDPLRWQVNFGLGAVRRLKVRLEEERARHAEEMARNSMGDVVALVCTRQSENSDYLEEKYGYRTDGKKTKAEQEAERRFAERALARQKAEEAEKARDPEGYARKQAEQKLANDKWWADYQKQQARNRKRRASYIPRGEPRYRRYTDEDIRRENQAEDARRAGHTAADRINLKPFLTGDVPADAPKKIKGN